MPCELMNFVIALAPLFSKPVLARVKMLLSRAILAVNGRTVCAMLRVVGKDSDKDFQNYHRVLNRAQWSAIAASPILLGFLIGTVAADATVVIGLDETIERRCGQKITARGIYREAVPSSRSDTLKCAGLRWLSVILRTQVWFAKRIWGLPFLTILSPAERFDKKRRPQHLSLARRATRILLLVKRWLPERQVVALGDSSFALLDLLHQVRNKMTMITRWRLDAALSQPAPERTTKRMGRPRQQGHRLPTLKAIAESRQSIWLRLLISDCDGEGEREIEISSATCGWFHIGTEALPIRSLLIKDALGKFKTQALLSTDLAAEPAQILKWFMRRWQIEVTVEEARRDLGVETQRQWSDKAIARPTPALFGLFSLIRLCAEELSRKNRLGLRQAAWYQKEVATFSDAIAAVRRSLWRQESFQISDCEAEVMKIPRPLFERLTETLCYAA